MELRTAASPRDVKHYTTERLREEFLIDDLFQPDVIKLVYSHIDRIITGSAVPVKETLKLTAGDELRAQYFCERRELGIINIGGAGTITIDGKAYHVAHKEGMYIGMGSRDITFASDDAAAPAKFYLNSAPAHRTCPTVLIKPEGTPEDGCHRQGLQQSRTRFPGDSKPQNNLQIYPSWSGRELPAGNGYDEARTGKRMEHNALPYTRQTHGGLSVFRYA